MFAFRPPFAINVPYDLKRLAHFAWLTTFSLLLASGLVSGQNNPSPNTNPPATITNKSLRLTGRSYVEVPSSESLKTFPRMTVEAWIRTDDAFRQQGIIEKYSATEGGFVLRLTDGKAVFGAVKTATEWDYVTGTTVLTPGVWYHIAGVYDGNEYRIYLNGTQEATKPATWPIGNGNSSLKIGARGDDGTQNFVGLIDEVRVMCGTQYAANFVPPSSLETGAFLEALDGYNIRGTWSFNKDNAEDTSGNENHGTLTGRYNFSSETNGFTGYAMPTAEIPVLVNFDSFPPYTTITNQYQYARFSSVAPTVPLTFSLFSYGTSLPSLSRNGSNAGYNHFAPLIVDFPRPANNLVFKMLAVDDVFNIALIKVYVNGNYVGTGQVTGNRTPYTPLIINIGGAGLNNVTKIEVYNIWDTNGVTFDDFTFNVTPAPTPTPTPTPQVSTVAFEMVNSQIRNM